MKELPSLPVASTGQGDTCLTLGHPTPNPENHSLPSASVSLWERGATNFFLLLSGCPEERTMEKTGVIWGCLKVGLGTPSDTAEMICARLGVRDA